MAGRGTISVNQTKQYGDTKALDAMKSLTMTPMTGVPTPAPSAGRPPTPGGGSPQARPSGAGPQAPAIPAEHQTAIQQMAQAMKTAKILSDKAAAPDAGPWLKYYAAVAAQRYQELALKLKADTPFFNMQA